MPAVEGAGRVEPSFGLHSIPFSVVSGTPTPLFSISFSGSSLVCHGCPEQQFHVTMVVKSLSHRSVVVNLCIDDYLEMWPQELGYRWREWGPHEIFSVLNEETGDDSSSVQEHKPEQEFQNVETFHPARGLVEFKHGSTHTYYFQFNRSDLGLLYRCRYILKPRPQGFAAWDYGTKAELSRTHWNPNDWRKHSPIMF